MATSPKAFYHEQRFISTRLLCAYVALWTWALTFITNCFDGACPVTSSEQFYPYRLGFLCGATLMVVLLSVTKKNLHPGISSTLMTSGCILLLLTYLGIVPDQTILAGSLLAGFPLPGLIYYLNATRSHSRYLDESNLIARCIFFTVSASLVLAACPSAVSIAYLIVAPTMVFLFMPKRFSYVLFPLNSGENSQKYAPPPKHACGLRLVRPAERSFARASHPLL